MKVVNLNTVTSNLYISWRKKAEEYEAADNTSEAIKAYEKCITFKPTDEYSYNRLIILLRKEKRYAHELKVIKAGIKAFSNYYSKVSSGKPNKMIWQLSIALRKSVGLTDKKGNDVYEHPTIIRFKKREELLRKRMSK